MQEVALDAHVDCDRHALEGEDSSWPHRVADMGPFDVLDVSATRNADGSDLTLVVVNRDPPTRSRPTFQLTDATFGRSATVHEVTGDDPAATNDCAKNASAWANVPVRSGNPRSSTSFLLAPSPFFG